MLQCTILIELLYFRMIIRNFLSIFTIVKENQIHLATKMERI